MRPAKIAKYLSALLVPCSIIIGLAALPTAAVATTLSLRSGASVEVRDFIDTPPTIADRANPGHYLLAGDLGYEKAGPKDLPYTIIFTGLKYSSFVIGLNRQPIGSARREAEQFLARNLGLDNAQMCELNYYLGTDVHTSKSYGGRNLGFSFCPGATPLPGDATAPKVTASVVGDEDSSRLLFDPSSGETFFRGSMFGLGQLTLGNVQNFCAQVHAKNRTWHLPTAAELEPLVNFLNQRGVDTPEHRSWRILSSPQPPGYILPTTTAQESISYGPNQLLFNVTVFKYEVLGSQFVSQLQMTVMNIIGPSLTSAPLTDGEGNRFPVSAICVLDRS